jgi:hypothetical protein
VASGNQIFPQLDVVVNLTVEHNPDGAIFIAQRLMAGGEVNDAKPPHPNANPSLCEDSIVIGAAVGHDVAHAADNSGVGPRIFAEFEHTRDPAHENYSRLLPRSLRRYSTESINSNSALNTSGDDLLSEDTAELNPERFDHSKRSVAAGCEMNL